MSRPMSTVEPQQSPERRLKGRRCLPIPCPRWLTTRHGGAPVPTTLRPSEAIEVAGEQKGTHREPSHAIGWGGERPRWSGHVRPHPAAALLTGGEQIAKLLTGGAWTSLGRTGRLADLLSHTLVRGIKLRSFGLDELGSRGRGAHALVTSRRSTRASRVD
jgi:hypothetical protein